MLWLIELLQVEIVKLLVESGANVNHRDNVGVTPLFWAAGDVLCIFLLYVIFVFCMTVPSYTSAIVKHNKLQVHLWRNRSSFAFSDV